MLVADLLQSIAHAPSPHASRLPCYNDDDLLSSPSDDEPLARACIVADSTAPPPKSSFSRPLASNPFSNMDFGIDFGSTSGFRSHPKKKKATPAAKFDSWGEPNEEKKDDGGANGMGGNDGFGGGDGGDTGAGGGGGDDNNNGGNDDDDAWGFSTGKKTKKKSKKKQEEEEEEERKRKEEEDAKAAASNPDPLSWADDANGDVANDDWTMSWGGTKKKDKKKKVGLDL